MPKSFSIEVKGTKEIITRIERIEKDLITPRLLERLAISGKERILTRTAHGKDYEGNEFKPYSPRYKKLRIKRGRSVDTVNLSFTGQMLADVHTRTDDGRGEAVIFFARTEEAKKAFYHHVSGAGRKKVLRKFFGLSSDDKKALRNIVREHIKETIGKR